MTRACLIQVSLSENTSFSYEIFFCCFLRQFWLKEVAVKIGLINFFLVSLAGATLLKKSVDFTVKYLASGCQFFYHYFYGCVPVEHF